MCFCQEQPTILNVTSAQQLRRIECNFVIFSKQLVEGLRGHNPKSTFLNEKNQIWIKLLHADFLVNWNMQRKSSSVVDQITALPNGSPDFNSWHKMVSEESVGLLRSPIASLNTPFSTTLCVSSLLYHSLHTSAVTSSTTYFSTALYGLLMPQDNIFGKIYLSSSSVTTAAVAVVISVMIAAVINVCSQSSDADIKWYNWIVCLWLPLWFLFCKQVTPASSSPLQSWIPQLDVRNEKKELKTKRAIWNSKKIYINILTQRN